MIPRTGSYINLFVSHSNTRKDSTYEKPTVHYIDYGNCMFAYADINTGFYVY